MKNLPCFDWDDDLALFADSHDTKNMFALRRDREAQVLRRFKTGKIIQRNAHHISDQTGSFQIRYRLSRLPFGNRLPGHSDLFRERFLRKPLHFP